MKTYQYQITPLFQTTYLFKLCFLLLLFLPVSLIAKDDCDGLLKDAKKYAKEVEKRKEAAEKAETKLQEARKALEDAKAALEEYENPVDETDHGSDVVKKKGELIKEIEKAGKALPGAKAGYYDALQKLIDGLKELDAKLKDATKKCDDELAEAERDRLRRKLEGFKIELDGLRDQHDLEERAGEPKEPENTEKKRDDLVDEELKALLEAILKELKAAYPDPGNYRDALRKKILEILDDWNDDFWKTDLGKELKKLLKEALQKAIDNPSGPEEDAPAEDQEESSSLPDPDQGNFKSLKQDRRNALGFGVSSGFYIGGMFNWCQPAPRINSLPGTNLGSVIHISNQDGLSVATPQGGTSLSDAETAYTFELEKDQAEIPCLDQWTDSPYYGMFLEYRLGRQWGLRLGGGFQEAQAIPVKTGLTFVNKQGESYSEKIEVNGQLQKLDLQLGIFRYFGQRRIQPLIGTQTAYRRTLGKTMMTTGSPEPKLENSRQSDQFGLQVIGGINIQLLKRLDIGLITQWDHYFSGEGQQSTQAVQFQVIWHP